LNLNKTNAIIDTDIQIIGLIKGIVKIY